MQTLQKNNKLAISLGAIAVIIASGAILSLSTLISLPDQESTDTPTSGMPVPGSNVPETIVSNEDSPTSSGMPVPGNIVPEMIVNPN